MEAQLKELIPFLRDKNPQVRQIALSNLVPQTLKGSPHRSIFFEGLQGGGLQKSKESDLIRDLKLLCRDTLATAHDAFRALVNLSDSSVLVPHLSEPLFLNYIISYIINPQSVLADLASMLLSNITTAPSACTAVISMNVSIIPTPSLFTLYYPTQSRSGTCAVPVPYPSGEPLDVLALPLLVDAFVQGAQEDPEGDKAARKRKGELHFLASVFANLTALPSGRDFFVTPRPSNVLRPEGDLECPLAKIIVFTEHKNIIRRGGVASTIKNCAFQVLAHRILLSPETTLVAVPPTNVKGFGIDILQSILLPLAGSEEFDLNDQDRLPPSLQFLPPEKKREPDEVLRLTHVETLILLCSSRWGRDVLRENGVYEILRVAHENETVDKISEQIERLVNLIKGEEGSNVEEVHEVVAAEEQPTTDDENDRIEEV